MRPQGFRLSLSGFVVAVQSLSCVRLFATPWTAALQASLSFTISCSLLKLVSVESVVLSNHLLLCLPYFSLMLSRSSPVITNGRISFSWLKSLYVYIPRPRCPSIRLQTLHCFVNDAALHTGAGVPLSQSAASSYKDPAADAGLSGMMPRLKTPNLTPSEKSLGVKVTGLQVLGSGHGHRRGHRLTDHGTDQVAPSILHKVSVSPGGENLLTALGCVLDHGLLSVGTTRLQPSLVTHCSLGGARAGLPRPPNPTDSLPLHKGGACVFLTRTCQQMHLGAWPIRPPLHVSPAQSCQPLAF